MLAEKTEPKETNSDQSQLKISGKDAPPKESEARDDDMESAERSSSQNQSTSDRQSQNQSGQPNSQSPNAGTSKPKPKQSSDADSPMREPAKSQTKQEEQKNDPKASMSGDPATMLPPPDSNSNQSQSRRTKPRDNMSRRGLDLPRPSSSQSMRLEVTEYVGSFEGVVRKKSEVAIAGTIAKTHESLELARVALTEVLSSSEDGEGIANTQWSETLQTKTDQAEQHLDDAVSVVNALLKQTRNTPYAFIGVQLSEIAHTHIQPAQDDLHATSKAQPKTRTALLMAARQQTIRAIERLSELYKRFERKKKQLDKDDQVRKVKKMYLVYLEDSLARLSKATQAERGGRKGLSRKMNEQEYEEEYLKRLKEVLEMQNELRAELVRILAEDPQLMRRYFQNFGDRGASLRSQLNELTDQQQELFQQVAACKVAQSKTEIDSLVIDHVAIVAGESLRFVRRGFEIEETFETWLPFQAGEPETIAATRKAFLGLQAAGAKISGHFESSVGRQILSGTADTSVIQSALPILSNSVDEMITAIDQTLIELNQLGQSDGRFASNVLRRMTELDRLRGSLARLNQKVLYLDSDEITASLGVNQWQVAEETHQLTEKLTVLQSELAGTIRQAGGTLPASIAQKCQQLLEMLDRDIEPMQLAAIRSLQDAKIERSMSRTGTAADEMLAACELLDDILADVIKLLDEMPADPLASTEDDPTLDEILAILEQERDRSETAWDSKSPN